VAGWAVEVCGLTIGLACEAFGLSKSRQQASRLFWRERHHRLRNERTIGFQKYRGSYKSLDRKPRNGGRTINAIPVSRRQLNIKA
jgi:hypothetical protein